MSRPEILLIRGMAEALRPQLEETYRITEIDGGCGAELPEEQRRSIRGVVLAGPDRFGEKELELFPGVEIISCYSVGYDGIDAEKAAQRGVMVTHTPEVLDDEVANTAIALILASTRRIVQLDRYVRQGRWRRDGPPPLTRGLAGKNVGLVGIGRIGQAIAEKLAVFNCNLGYHARTRRDGLPYRYFDDLRALARHSDILVVIVPGGPQTNNLVDREILDLLGPEGTLINVARGSVVDEPALVDALQEGRLGSAGLDVFADEPNVPEALFELENVVLLPHVGSATVETRKAMRDLAIRNLDRWFADRTALTPVPECRKRVTG